MEVRNETNSLFCCDYTVSFVTVLLPNQKANAWTTDNLRWMLGEISDGDSWFNYDFTDDNWSTTNVDWPVNLVFEGSDVDISLVKTALWGTAGWPDAKMWNFVNDDGGPGEWHDDYGTKEHSFYANHMRPYAPNNTYGYYFGFNSIMRYCIGSSHRDNWPNVGYSEEAEQAVCNELSNSGNWFIWEDYYNFHNPENRTECHWPEYHRWQSDGWASLCSHIVWYWP